MNRDFQEEVLPKIEEDTDFLWPESLIVEEALQLHRQIFDLDPHW